MNTLRNLFYRFYNPKTQVALLTLLLLLQRMPVIKHVLQFEKALSAPMAQMIRSIVFSAGTLGAFQAYTGASTYIQNPSGNPLTVDVGEDFQMAFAVTDTKNPASSWDIQGNLPPGLTIPGAVGNVLNANVGTIVGTPTKAGTFNFSLQPFHRANLQGDTTVSGAFPVTIIVEGFDTVFSTMPGSPAAGTAGDPIEVAFGIDGLDAQSWRVSGALPNGVSVIGSEGESVSGGILNASSGFVSGTPTDSGFFEIALEAFTEINLGGDTDGVVNLLTLDIGSGILPTIGFEPLPISVRSGGRAQLFATGAGTNLSFQWKKDGVAIEGANDPDLVIDSVSAGDQGSYSVLVSNALDEVGVESAGAALTVVESGESKLVNISTRGEVLTGFGKMVAGFVIGGESNKQVLIRASGQALREVFEFPGTVEDPFLQLFQGSEAIANNDNWGESANLVALENATSAAGAFGFPDGSRDAALLVDLAPGGYSAHVTGIDGTTGVALVEVYDVSDEQQLEGRLVNISTRGEIGTGFRVMSAGFVIEGDVAKTLLIRASGPQLAADFNFEGTIENPRLEVFQGSSAFHSNEDWDDPDGNEVAQASETAGAFLFQAGLGDAGTVVTLPPGSYTVRVSGEDSVTGIGLVEVYEID